METWKYYTSKMLRRAVAAGVFQLDLEETAFFFFRQKRTRRVVINFVILY
ncbi:hypothetical protein B4113_0421 [Geobacillus sp. B4113_201601]|nr:hypothetical protein B4113_0421 [Geobacillus sp. B4113_201601]